MGIPVLVVDDDGAIRETLRCLLEDEGYTVFDAPDGKPALTCLREHPAGMVVLLDLQISGRDGLAFLHVIAQHTSLPTRHAFMLMSAIAATTHRLRRGNSPNSRQR